MARTPRGTKPQSQTKTALFAYLAAQLAGIPVRAFSEQFAEWGLAVRQDGATEAASFVKEQSGAKNRRGRRPPQPPAARPSPARPSPARPSPVVRDWLLIDELRLGLELALLRFPGAGRQQTDLMRRLRETAGVRQIIETAHERDLFVVVIFSGPQGRRELRARLEEIADRIIWDDVLYETHDPAQRTWLALTLSAAAEEELLEGPVSAYQGRDRGSRFRHVRKPLY